MSKKNQKSILDWCNTPQKEEKPEEKNEEEQEIEDDDEDKLAKKEEKKKYKNCNKNKLIEDEADADDDEEDDEDGDYEEDEGEDDEKSIGEELALHRDLKLKQRGKQKLISDIKNKADKKIAEEIAQEDYVEDSFVAGDNSISYYDIKTIGRKRLLKKSKIIEDDEEDEYAEYSEKKKKLYKELDQYYKEKTTRPKFKKPKIEEPKAEKPKKIIKRETSLIKKFKPEKIVKRATSLIKKFKPEKIIKRVTSLMKKFKPEIIKRITSLTKKFKAEEMEIEEPEIKEPNYKKKFKIREVKKNMDFIDLIPVVNEISDLLIDPKEGIQGQKKAMFKDDEMMGKKLFIARIYRNIILKKKLEILKLIKNYIKTEEPKIEEPKTEEPKAEEPKIEEPKTEEPKAEEPKIKEIENNENEEEIEGYFDLIEENRKEWIEKYLYLKKRWDNIKDKGEDKNYLESLEIEELENIILYEIRELLKEEYDAAKLKPMFKFIFNKDIGDDRIEQKKYIMKFFKIPIEEVPELYNKQLVKYINKNGEEIEINRRTAERMEKDRLNEINEQQNRQKENEIFYKLKDKITINLKPNNINLNDIEDKSDEKIKLKKIGGKLDNNSLGIVVYMTKSKYSENIEENRNIHIPDSKEIISLAIAKWLTNTIGGEKHCVELIVNHEHGKKNKKCHYQCFASFTERLRNKVYPGEFNIEDRNYICMLQGADSAPRLRNYCKKKSDCVDKNDKYLDVDFKDKTIGEFAGAFSIEKRERDNEKDATELKKLMNKPHIDMDDIVDAVKKSNNLYEQHVLIKDGEKIVQFHTKYVAPKPIIPPHKWVWPKYIDDELNKYTDETIENTGYELRQRRIVFKAIKKWFFKYCINNDRDNFNDGYRKRGLMIFGLRSIGKTTLCKNFLPHPFDPKASIYDNPYIVYCRGSIAARFFKEKEEHGQLVLWDDIQLRQDQVEMAKNITTGQPSTVRSNFVDDYRWNYSCPCIILTNSTSIYKWFKNSEEWNRDIEIIGCDVFLGPLDKKEEAHCDEIAPHYITPGMQGFVRKKEDEAREKKMEKMFFIKK